MNKIIDEVYNNNKEIINLMADKHICTSLNDDLKTIEIHDNLDFYYEVKLTKAQLSNYIKFLQDLHKIMEY